MPLAHDQLQALADALARVQGGSLGAAAWSALARQQADLLAALPPRYQEVLLQLLDRLEAGALFTEESCSFSQHDLLDSLQVWVDKASGQLHP